MNELDLYSRIALISIAFVGIILVFSLFYLKKTRRTTSPHPEQDQKDSLFQWTEPPPLTCQVEPDIKVAYRQKGKGRDLLLIHGIGANTYSWRRVADDLCQSGYRVTIIDLPGFGYSSKDPNHSYNLDYQTHVVDTLVKKLKLKKVILIGSSMGATIALWLSQQSPSKYPQVVAIAPAAGKNLVPAVFRKVKNLSSFFNRGLNRNTMKFILTVLYTDNSLVTDQTIDQYLNPYLTDKTVSIQCFINGKDLIQDPRLPKELSKLKTTPLVLWGKKDVSVRKKNIKEVLKHLPNSCYFQHNKGGHHLMEDEPVWVLEKIKYYLALN